jgi:hypothetical protein
MIGRLGVLNAFSTYSIHHGVIEFRVSVYTDMGLLDHMVVLLSFF